MLPLDANGNVAQVGRIGTVQDMTIAASSTQSTAVATEGAIAVRVVATVECRISIGSNPTATATGLKLVAGIPEYFAARKGEKVAVIGTSGSLNIAEIA